MCSKTQEEQIKIVNMISRLLPYDLERYIAEFRKKPLDNDSIRLAVKNHFKGGDDKNAMEKVYCNIKYWDTSQVTNMSSLFKHNRDFNDDISRWDTSNVTNMEYMFHCAATFNQPIGVWDTSKLYTMKHMF